MVTGIVFPGLSELVWEVRNSCSSKVVATVGGIWNGECILPASEVVRRDQNRLIALSSLG